MKLRIIQDAVTLVEHMKRIEASPEDIERLLLEDLPRRSEWQGEVGEEFERRLPLCPECGQKMSPYRVNTGPGDQIGGEFTTQLICRCGYEEFNEEDFSKWVVKPPPDTELMKMFGAFAPRDLYEIMGVFAWAESKGKTLDDLREMVQNVKRRRPMRIISKECPSCGGIMKLSVGEEDMSDSQWTCKKCRFGEYVPKPFWEVIKDGAETN